MAGRRRWRHVDVGCAGESSGEEGTSDGLSTGQKLPSPRVALALKGRPLVDTTEMAAIRFASGGAGGGGSRARKR